MAHLGHCGGESGKTLPSPVNAIGIVLEHEDGTIEARLAVRSDTVEAATPVAASDVELAVGSQRYPLEGEPGHYRTELTDVGYDPEVPFTLGFSIDSETASERGVYDGRFTMSSHGPWDRPEAWLEGDQLLWSPGGLPVYVEVRGEDGGTIWRNFEPFAETPDYQAMAPGGLVLPAEAFSGLDEHEALVCAVEAMGRDELSASPQHVTKDVGAEGELGWLSGMVVGRCARLTL